jgi:hypothetical protein
MKSYVIYLPSYQQSCSMANRACDTGRQFDWNINLWPGVDGRLLDWAATGVNINSNDAKCRNMMLRPGVQGCFMSHYRLWQHCVEINKPIGIFEHDIEFLAAPKQFPDFAHVLKLEGFLKKKPRPAGEWYEGARAYIIKPAGAARLLNWVNQHGALPADVAIGLDVVDIELDQSNKVQQHPLYGKTDKRENSFTWNLERMT